MTSQPQASSENETPRAAGVGVGLWGHRDKTGGLGLPSPSVSLYSRSSAFGMGLFSRGLWGLSFT